MKIVTTVENLVKICFTIDPNNGDDVFHGSIVMKPNEYAGLDAIGLETLQLHKYSEWCAARQPADVLPDEVVLVMKEEQINQLNAQLNELNSQIDVLSTSISLKANKVL